MSDVLFPNIDVQLVGSDGNAFALIAKVRQALRRNKVSTEQISEFTEEATSGDYDNLLCTCMRWVNVS